MLATRADRNKMTGVGKVPSQLRAKTFPFPSFAATNLTGFCVRFVFGTANAFLWLLIKLRYIEVVHFSGNFSSLARCFRLGRIFCEPIGYFAF